MNVSVWVSHQAPIFWKQMVQITHTKDYGTRKGIL